MKGSYQFRDCDRAPDDATVRGPLCPPCSMADFQTVPPGSPGDHYYAQLQRKSRVKPENGVGQLRIPEYPFKSWKFPGFCLEGS